MLLLWDKTLGQSSPCNLQQESFNTQRCEEEEGLPCLCQPRRLKQSICKPGGEKKGGPKVGNTGMASSILGSPCTPLGCILRNWNKFAGEPLTKPKMKKNTIITGGCNSHWIMGKNGLKEGL